MKKKFGSQVVETLLYRLATDPQSVTGKVPEYRVQDTPVGSRIHRMPVPAKYPFPFLTWARRGALDTGPVGRGLPTVAATLQYEVKGVDTGSDFSRIEDAANIMDYLLDGQSFELFLEDSLYDVSVTRSSELEVELPPEDDGTTYVHLGGIYDFYVAKLT